MKLGRLLIILVLIATTGGVLWTYRDRLPRLEQLPQLGTLVQQRTTDAVQQIRQDISAPPPLRDTSSTSPSATLSVAGTLKWTNVNRANGGLAPLALESHLTAAAQAKVKDMFAKQYFEHVSPSGVGPGDLATQAGYAYVLEGENLALGNFESDKALLEAWMNSPGHRANIMNTRYTQIGIAVGKGTFEGHTTWLAVQEFGRPLSDCPPRPSVDLKARIDAEEALLSDIKVRADQKRAEIDAMGKPRTREEADRYNAAVDEYNALVAQENAYIEEIKQLISAYNAQVSAFNACASA